MNHEQQIESRIPDRRKNDCRSSVSESSVAHLHHSQLTTERHRSGPKDAPRPEHRDRERLGEGASIMVEVIITTAVVTSIIVIMAQLAWVEVKRRARSRKRKIRRAVTKRIGTHSHKIFSRKPDYNVAPPWGRTVSLEEHRKQFSDSLFNQ